MVSEGVPDVCDFDPGYEVAATVEASLLTLTQIWRGDLSWSRAMLNGDVTVHGSHGCSSGRAEMARPVACSGSPATGLSAGQSISGSRGMPRIRSAI